MQVLYPRCAGLDVHKDVIVACVRCVSTPVHQEVRSFPTTTSGLQSLDEWLSSHACTHVAMEATGVYWKPVWHILEADFELVLANAAHIKNVPGRKTDVNDATWIADLLAHGLIRSSFVPPAPIQELRDLTRTRKQLVREISQHSSRIQKIPVMIADAPTQRFDQFGAFLAGGALSELGERLRIRLPGNQRVQDGAAAFAK